VSDGHSTTSCGRSASGRVCGSARPVQFCSQPERTLVHPLGVGQARLRTRSVAAKAEFAAGGIRTCASVRVVPTLHYRRTWVFLELLRRNSPTEPSYWSILESRGIWTHPSSPAASCDSVGETRRSSDAVDHVMPAHQDHSGPEMLGVRNARASSRPRGSRQSRRNLSTWWTVRIVRATAHSM
jgi:hypothetical protein